MKKYVFEQYSDRLGWGEVELFDSKEEAVRYADREWNHLTKSDRERRTMFFVYEVEITDEQLQEFEEGDGLPISEYWTADVRDFINPEKRYDVYYHTHEAFNTSAEPFDMLEDEIIEAISENEWNDVEKYPTLAKAREAADNFSPRTEWIKGAGNTNILHVDACQIIEVTLDGDGDEIDSKVIDTFVKEVWVDQELGQNDREKVFTSGKIHGCQY